MSQKNLVKIKCQETGQIIHTTRNKKNGDKKLELKKYNPTLRKHTLYKEVKK
jgi:large subunit ribosomal protein L33